ncbi:MAG: GNAT family N-acetyltransferase [Verrucomicrobia bacterium]|nr:GNAT family N-acetyltransferase [Verrucomicrobiota bacterium]MDA1067168.1 GNAT family N-acetyltransferase [Verrucomicrobiota bacterium]
METQTIPPLSFVTENIAGRKPTLADTKAMFDTYAQDPEVTRYLVFKPYEKIEDLQSWLSYIIKEWDKKPGIMYLLHKRNEPDVLVGSFSIIIDGFKAEVGYLLARPYWGQGMITEVLRYWIGWALAQPKIFRIGAVCDVDNPASGRVMEKAGMEFEGTLRRWSMHPNMGVEPRDVHSYAKVR